MRQHYQGTLIACGSYTFESALDEIKNNFFDLTAMGRPFIANPDLINRFATGKNLNQYEPNMLNILY